MPHPCSLANTHKSILCISNIRLLKHINNDMKHIFHQKEILKISIDITPLISN